MKIFETCWLKAMDNGHGWHDADDEHGAHYRDGGSRPFGVTREMATKLFHIPKAARSIKVLLYSTYCPGALRLAVRVARYADDLPWMENVQGKIGGIHFLVNESGRNPAKLNYGPYNVDRGKWAKRRQRFWAYRETFTEPLVEMMLDDRLDLVPLPSGEEQQSYAYFNVWVRIEYVDDPPLKWRKPEYDYEVTVDSGGNKPEEFRAWGESVGDAKKLVAKFGGKKKVLSVKKVRESRRSMPERN